MKSKPKKKEFSSFKKFTINLILIMILSVGMVYSQQQVTGTVTDQKTGQTLPGVSIIEKGNPTHGTTTNVDGEYTITVSEDASLVFSFVGYQAKEVPVNGRAVVNVKLKQSVEELEEVVIVGYGTQKKKNLTGSVSSVNASTLEGQVAPNTSDLLQGKMSGVTVQSFANHPGKGDPQIRIRGIRSFNDNNPMVVIDGVKSSISTLSKIPSEDIKDISILKDAASASIYGVRAANGVILVETKSGQTGGAPEVLVKENISWQQPVFKPDYLDSWDWAHIQNVVAEEMGEEKIYTDDMIAKMKNDDPSDGFVNNNWFNQLTRTAPMQDHYVRVSGGTDKASYHFSANYKNQQGIVIGSHNKKYALRSNINVNLSDKLETGLKLFGYKQRIDEPGSGNAGNAYDFESSLIYRARWFAMPTVPVRYPNGDWAQTDGAYANTHHDRIFNVVDQAQRGEEYTQNYRLEGKVFADYEILKNLHFRTNFSTQIHNLRDHDFNPTYERYDWDGNVVRQDYKNDVRNFNALDYEYANENMIRYNNTFGKHSVSFLGGYSIEYHRNDHFSAYGENLPNNNIHVLGAAAENKDVDGGAWETAIQSLFSRVNYSFDDKYLFEFNIRRDGSSRLPKENRYAIFPSFSAGWVVTQEPFMQEVPILSSLKLRGSWGQLGNQEIGRYPYAQTLGIGTDYIIGGAVQPGVSMEALANDQIRWETTEMINVGMDAYFFDNRLQMIADYYQKKTTDILMRLPIPDLVGYLDAPYQNAGAVDNYGWDLDVNWQDQIENFRYNLGFKLSHVRNEISDLAGREEIIDSDNINRVGHPIDAYYGYVNTGFFLIH